MDCLELVQELIHVLGFTNVYNGINEDVNDLIENITIQLMELQVHLENELYTITEEEEESSSEEEYIC